MTRSEMREIAAQEENHAALYKRDLPMIEAALGRARTFRARVCEEHCFCSGDILDNFLTAFDDAYDAAYKAYEQLRDA
jgi:hypothetical protein